ncbi:MAG: phosphoenolpyruvate mutase [Nanoarchaeota archaeon]|nr:phosphoenolpyruvate mutase [Nanoarchaeota archaeon]
MKAIIVAAGMGNRLLHMTKNVPKCMLKVRNTPLLHHLLENFKQKGIEDISIVKGFLKDKIVADNVKSYYNDEYSTNNVAASLMKAESELNDDCIVSYGDIMYDASVINQLLKSEGDIVIAVKEQWQTRYEKKSPEDLEGAEKAIFKEGIVEKIGRSLSKEANGEFIGVAKFSKKAIEQLTATFKEMDIDEKFHDASTLKVAYLSDMIQELIKRGMTVKAIAIQGNWVEIDNLDDLKAAGGQITSEKITPEKRRALLKKTLQEKGFVRAIEAHNGISSIIVNNSILPDKTCFDAVWISSLTESAAKGQPDIEVMGFESRLKTVQEVMDVSNLPIIIDGDTGGDINAFEMFVQRAEALGTSVIIIEDKVYPKRNSLDAESEQLLADPFEFAKKIQRGKQTQLTDDFMIIARIESLIANMGQEDALERAKTYLEAGVDGIMIHSKSKDGKEILDFVKEFKVRFPTATGPLVSVPTTYNELTEEELREAGFSIVIHANHLIRACIKVMQNTCISILKNGRSLEASKDISTVAELFDLVGFSDIKTKEKSQEIKNDS